MLQAGPYFRVDEGMSYLEFELQILRYAHVKLGIQSIFAGRTPAEIDAFIAFVAKEYQSCVDALGEDFAIEGEWEAMSPNFSYMTMRQFASVGMAMLTRFAFLEVVNRLSEFIPENHALVVKDGYWGCYKHRVVDRISCVGQLKENLAVEFGWLSTN